MSLITDPWDDDDVQVEELDSRFKKIRTVQHRTVSNGITSLDLTFYSFTILIYFQAFRME